MEKVLGKITSVEFGKVHDYPFLFGLQLNFSLGDGTCIGSGSKYTINISKECRWEEQERTEACTTVLDGLNKILTDAKVNYVSELKNKPIEVTIDHNTFVDFRILTEVL